MPLNKETPVKLFNRKEIFFTEEIIGICVTNVNKHV